ncbi:hypothetical protein LJC20_02735 [Eubacteriales bacterium OttesenSCG-928-M02]|nr:hypothetical protein [Eubacteriales bacterium OttesenSCG-928-M02]
MNRFFALYKVEMKLMLGWSTIKANFKAGAKGILKNVGFLLVALLLVGSLGFAYVAFLDIMFEPASMLGLGDAVLTMVVLMAMLLSFMLSIYQCVGLYYNKEADFLFSLPITQRTAFAGKFMPLLTTEILVDAAIILPAMLVYTQYAGGDAIFWIKGILVILLASMIPLCLAAILASLFMRITAVVRHKDKIVMALGILFFIVYFVGVQLLSQSMVHMDMTNIMAFLTGGVIKMITTVFPPARWAAEAMVYGGSTGLLGLLKFAGLSILAFVLTLVVAGNSFIKLSGSQSETFNSNKKVALDQKTTKAGSGFSALHRKEWKVVLRSPMVAMNSLIMAIVGPIVILTVLYMPQAGLDGNISDLLMEADVSMLGIPSDAFFFITLVVAAFLYFFSSINAGAATIYSREGRSTWLLKTLPLSPKHIAGAKLLFGHEVVLLCVVPTVVLLGILSRSLISPLYVLLAGVLVIVANIPNVAFAEMFDMIRPTLNWTNETAVVKRSLSVFVQMLVAWLWLVPNVFLCIGIGKLGGGPGIMLGALLGLNLVVGVVLTVVLFRIAPSRLQKMGDD